MSPQRALPDPLRAVLRRLPTGPGVYLMKNADGRVLYVGKADALRSRVRSYFGAARAGGRAHRADDRRRSRTSTYIVTDTVSEAYLLESNLIKEHRPRFNIRLRDDKSYPFVKITLGEDFPRIVRTRKLARDGSRYFGPYASASERRRDAEAAAQDLSVPDLQPRHPRGEARPRTAVPAVLHQPLPGPVHSGHREGAVPGQTIGQIVDFLDGRQEPIARAAAARDGGPLRGPPIRAGGRDARQAARRRAHDGAAEDGGLQPRRARRHRPGTGGRRGLHPGHAGASRQAHRPRALRGRVVPATRPMPRHSARSFSSTTPTPTRSRALSWRRSCRPAPTTWPPTSPTVAACASRSACRSAARSGDSSPSRRSNAVEALARERAEWLADVGEAGRGAPRPRRRALARRVRRSGSSATT